MDTKRLWICAIALIALAAAGMGGCGSNQAENQEPAPLAAETDGYADADADAEAEADGLPVNSEAAAEAKTALAAERLAVAEREAELARRELAAAQAERKLAEQARNLEKSPPAAVAKGVTAAPKPSQPIARVAEEPAVRTVYVNVPASTSITVEFADTLSSDTNLAGDGFRATVARDIFHDGYLAIPAGSHVHGTVADAVPSKRIGGQASMELRFDRVDLPSGEIVPIQAMVQLTGESQKKKDAATIGGSAAGGALIGRIIGKKKTKGTAIGAVLGAAVGTAVASRNEGDPIVVEPGTLAELFLESPVEVAVVVDPTDALADNR